MRVALFILFLNDVAWSQDLDGSKIFTTDTTPLEPGTFSLGLQYLTSSGNSEFLSGGGRCCSTVAASRGSLL